MRQYMAHDTKRLGVHKHDQRRIAVPVEEQKRIHIFIRIWATFWALHCRHSLKPYLALSCPQGYYGNETGNHLGKMVKGSLSYVGNFFGCTLIPKLRSILLMEADFNVANKIVFGQRMLDNAREHNLIQKSTVKEIASPRMAP